MYIYIWSQVWYHRIPSLPSVPALKLPVPVVPAAAVVSGGAGPGAPLLPTDPTQRPQGWGSPARETGHQTPNMDNSRFGPTSNGIINLTVRFYFLGL